MRIHAAQLLVDQHGIHLDVLLLCELADDALVCDDPPRLIRWVPIPNKGVNFSCDAVSGYPMARLSPLLICVHRQSSKRIDISVPTEWSFSLVFEDLVDYWEIMRIISEVNTIDALRRRAIDELVQGAIATIPTVRIRSPSPAPGGVPASSELPAGDEGAQAAVTGSASSSVNAGTQTLEDAE